VQFAVTFLATGLADVTMLIAHHFPGLRCEAQTWPRVRPLAEAAPMAAGFLGASMGARRAILVASACNACATRATCVRFAWNVLIRCCYRSG
jgi:hypothetical protein